MHDAAPLPNPNGALFVLDRPDQKSGDRTPVVWKELDHVAAIGKARVGKRHQLSGSRVIEIQQQRVARKRDDGACDLVFLFDLVCRLLLEKKNEVIKKKAALIMSMHLAVVATDD